MPKKCYPEKGFKTKLIAPCGLNCRVCNKYIRENNKCSGCRADESIKPKSKWVCHIKECEILARDKIDYCYQCNNYPCESINRLNKRYTKQYSVSVIKNLNEIQLSGVRAFLKNEARHWTCISCGDIVTMHKSKCPHCKEEIEKEQSNKAL